MASTFNIITPEQHVENEVGKLLAVRFSFLEEQRRQLAALPDAITAPSKENKPIPNYCPQNNKPNSK